MQYRSTSTCIHIHIHIYTQIHPIYSYTHQSFIHAKCIYAKQILPLLNKLLVFIDAMSPYLVKAWDTAQVFAPPHESWVRVCECVWVCGCVWVCAYEWGMLQCTATHCNTLQYTAIHCNTHADWVRVHADRHHFQHFIEATHCNTLPHTAIHCNTLQRAATHCNAPQPTATHCNPLQPTATHCNTRTIQMQVHADRGLLWMCHVRRTNESWYTIESCPSTLNRPYSTYTCVWCVVVCSRRMSHSVLQCVAVCGSVLQCVAVCCSV